jgi:hypothetical protein
VNTFWRSDVFLSAPGDSGGTFFLTWTDAVTGERIIKHGTMRAHEVLPLGDIVGTFFERTGFGSVRADLDGNLVATSRTFTSSSNGTYGQFVPFGDMTDIVNGPRQLLHVERSSAFRTNLGVLNTGDLDEIIRFTLYDAAGHAAGSTDRKVGPLRVVQFSLEELTASPVIDGRVEVEVIAGSGKALAWASVVDNITGDPIFVPAQ